MTQYLLLSAVQQFSDANGNPYAGGSLYTYIPGTSTPKNTWQDEAGTVLNTQPIILDAAGRAIIWSTGDTRLVLRDVNGVLVYDQVTTTAPLPTDIGTINDNLTAEIDRATAAESTLTTNLNTEIAARIAGDAAVPLIQHGSTATASDGHAHVDFVTGYSDQPSVVCTHDGTGWNIDSATVAASLTGFDVWFAHPDPITGAAVSSPVGFHWIAIGPH